ncbi:thin pilus assembly periplasmic chaperone AcuD [uncultured Acinetobacter sp.]|uniref:thin pilus assembly periplasmic chaperone AcuD n=1 Tax=uncultured Acinetobacter sp. TaxID=165433 RepID=UPI0025866E22|nr:thin pilus assembly periplasmic chaperone AcuD [uncultured Acinetobacter sp.]
MRKFGFFFSIVLISQYADAGVSIDGTRIIFPSNAKSVSVQLRNEFTTPALVQTWIDQGDMNSIPPADQIPFVLTPPLARVEPKKGQIIRIIPTGSPALPQDRESLYWFNMLDIPPDDSANKDKNILTFNVRSRIKLFYRPTNLKISSDKAFSSIGYNYDNDTQSVVLNNPTPYYVTVTKINFKNQSRTATYTSNAVMLAPFSQQNLNNFQLKFKPNQISYTVINDLGGDQTFEMQ